MPKSTSVNNANSDAGAAKTQALGDVGEILTQVGETAYAWDVCSDTFRWADNAARVLGMKSVDPLVTCAGFREHIVPEHRVRHVREFADCSGDNKADATPYLVHYRFNANGPRRTRQIWLEDKGLCERDANGCAVVARGVLRVVAEDDVNAQSRAFGGDFDELTGQISRGRLMDALDGMLRRAQRTQSQSAFLMAAISNLGMINENFGFEAGDQVISSVAKSLRGTIRSGDTLGRYSSNKFGIILNDCRAASTRAAAERLLATIRNTTIETAQCPLSVTLSIGGVVFPDQAENVENIVGRALQALETSKHERDDCFVAYQACERRDNMRARNASIAENVAQALTDDRLRLALQPMISTRTGKAEIHECLLRMEDQDGSLITAGEFIAVAEQIGLWRMIDYRTMQLAVDLLKKHDDLQLALNVSANTASDHGWLVKLHKATGGKREITRRLTIEITETAAISDLDQTMAFCELVKEIGCRVAIDDFGAGYTSFKNLKYLNVDMVKIDGSFVENFTTDPANRIFIKTMVELAENFGMETVAEWVGDNETAELLGKAGVTYLQGFHYGQPFDAREFDRGNMVSAMRT